MTNSIMTEDEIVAFLKDLRRKARVNTSEDDISVDEVNELLKAFVHGFQRDFFENEARDTWFFVAYYNLIEIVKFLIANEVKEFRCWKSQESALITTLRRGHIDMVRLLLEHGWDANRYVDAPLGNALSIAAETGNVQAFCLLLKHGASLRLEWDSYYPKGRHCVIDEEWLIRCAIKANSLELCLIINALSPNLELAQERIDAYSDQEPYLEFCESSGIPVLINYAEQWREEHP